MAICVGIKVKEGGNQLRGETYLGFRPIIIGVVQVLGHRLNFAAKFN